ncbi:MAG: glycosyltransferase family 39 protein [Solirubrobacteraceae bacterium]|nr:glycosyltransferase family 39 protein [Solirubrobacteraceae bacterium]
MAASAGRPLARVRAWRPDRWLVGILAVALGLRLGVVLATPDHAPWGDPADYDRLAATFALLGDWAPTQYAAPGSPTAFRAPAYPGLLAVVYDVVGLDARTRWTAGRVVGALLGVVTVALTWGIARRLWADVRVARAAAGIVAALPSLVWLSGGLVAETLFVPLVLAALLVTLVHRDRPDLRLALLAGALVGVAALTRTNGLSLILPVAIGLWSARRRPAAPAVAVVALVVVLVPWTVRNHHALDRFLPLGTHSGYTMAGVWNAESATRGGHFAHSRVPAEVPTYRDLFDPPRLTEAQLDRELRSRALDYALDHPGFVVEAAALRGLRLFHLGPGHDFVAGLSARETGVPDGWRWMIAPGVWLVLLGALAAVALRLRRRIALGPWWTWLAPGLILLSAAPLVGAPRYRVPLDPFLALLAGAAIVVAVDAWRSRRAQAG